MKALVLAGLVSGCYHYTPIEYGAVSPGMDVRARVSASTAERITPLLGTSARVVTGPVVDRGASTFVVEVPTVVQAGIAGATQTLHQRIALAPADVVELERRTLDRPKTALIVGAAAIATIATTIAALHGNPGIDHPSTPSPTENRIPIFKIRF